jgi:hypothetical protein
MSASGMSDADISTRPIAVDPARMPPAVKAGARRTGRVVLALAGVATGLLWLTAMAYILVQLVTWWMQIPNSFPLHGSPWPR